MNYYKNGGGIMAKRRKSGTGFKRPPSEHQFKPGVSGNPGGRPKGSGRLARVARKEAARRITYVEDGVRKKIRTDDAIVRQALLSAVKGDYRAIPIALKLLDREETERLEATSDTVFDEAVDELVMADIVRRIRAMDEPPADSTTTPQPPEDPSNQPKE